MKTFFVLLGIGTLMVVLLLFAIGYASDGRARTIHAQSSLVYAQGQSESMIIRAQADSRLASATAASLISAALLPWGILGVLGLLGIAVVGLCLVLVFFRAAASFDNNRRPPQIVQEVVYLLPPPGPRRETWKLITDGRDRTNHLITSNNQQHYSVRR